VLNDLIRTCGLDLGHHEGLRRCGDYNCAWKTESARGVNGGETRVAAGRAEDVRDGGQARPKVLEPPEDVIANSSAESQYVSERRGVARAYRDLKEPEGWSVSILRKILLLRFRIPSS
jgi:hypothetical protein